MLNTDVLVPIRFSPAYNDDLMLVLNSNTQLQYNVLFVRVRPEITVATLQEIIHLSYMSILKPGKPVFLVGCLYEAAMRQLLPILSL